MAKVMSKIIFELPVITLYPLKSCIHSISSFRFPLRDFTIVSRSKRKISVKEVPHVE